MLNKKQKFMYIHKNIPIDTISTISKTFSIVVPTAIIGLVNILNYFMEVQMVRQPNQTVIIDACIKRFGRRTKLKFYSNKACLSFSWFKLISTNYFNKAKINA